MSEQPSDDRLHRLMEQLVNGTITAEQHDELQTLLLDNADAQTDYFDFIDLHIGLQKLTTDGPTDQSFPTPPHPVLAHSDDDSHATDARQTSLFALVITFAVAALLFGLLPALLDRGDDSNPQLTGPGDSPSSPQRQIEETSNNSQALLTQAAGAELFGEFLPRVGEALEFDHEYALVGGMIELTFPDGAEVILEAPSVIEIADRERLIVSTGNCSVHAPPGAEGFQVETPQTEIIDLGTRFSVSVSEVGETDVQVIEGLAEVRETHDQGAEPIQLSERQARRFSGDVGSGPRSLDFDGEDYRRNLPDRIISYQAGPAGERSVSDLQSLTLQRDGRVITVPVTELIGVKVTHFRAGANNANVAVPVGYEGDRLAGLETDALLHTGVLNPGGSVEPLKESPVLANSASGDESTPGLAIQFRRPVINLPGPDVVFFELQTVVNPPEGDAFHVSPVTFQAGLHSHSIRRYDIAMTSREAQALPDFDLYFFRTAATSLEELMAGEVDRRPQTLRFRALAVGIDLSDLGYLDNAAVEGLFFQDALDDQHVVDPVFIAGLPDSL